MPETPRLEDYRRKRERSRTPEPFDEDARPEGGDGPIFVVQRHSARRLHYDLRLERDGVLMSWAVPKGLPTAPGARRLAVHTEDHPMKYATFEGVIPKGEYGAGTMDVYDTGPYEEVERKRDGGLTFRLHGRHLDGLWALVPARLDGEERNWLLLCKQGPGDRDRPRYEPMLATIAEDVPGGAEWLHEVKWDGFRTLARLADGEPDLWSRRGNSYGERFPAIASDLGRGLRTPDCVVDGEICALDRAGRPSFQLLQRGEGTPVLYVFDVLELEGERLSDRPLAERREILAGLVDETSKTVRLSPAFDDGQALLAAARAQGLEGIMCKRRDSLYLPGRRSSEWRKVKVRQSDVFAIAGFVTGEGARERMGSLILAACEGDELVYVGNCGTGFTGDEIDRLLALIEPLRRETPPVAGPVRDPRLRRGRVRWAEPELRCLVEFAEWTADGRVRAPAYKRLADPGEAVTRVPHEADEGDAGPPEFAHLDRVLFPDDGITKGELLDYYRRIAPVLLPHLHDRPLVLRRAPEGIDGPVFFQKDAPEGTPAWIRTVAIEAESRRDRDDPTVRAPIADDLRSLLWLVNVGSWDLHVLLSRADEPELPDAVLFDLDPGAGVGFDAVVRTALRVRDALAGIGLAVHAKTSGKDGMHLVVPIARGPSYAATRAFARTVATAVARAYPDESTAELARRRRRGVLIDWKQNSIGASIASAYSVRPVAGAPVSCPLDWDEVDESLDPRAFTMEAVLERADRLGDVFAPVLEGGQDIARFVAGGEG